MIKPAIPAFEEVKREEFSRLFGVIATRRLWVVPAIAGLMAWILAHHVTPWRRNTLLLLGTLAIFFFVREALVHRRDGNRPRALTFNLLGAVFGHGIATFSTGGLGSPFLFAMFPVLMVGVLVLSPRVSLTMAGLHGLIVWGMALAELSQRIPNWNLVMFGGGPHTGWNQAHVLWNGAFLTAGIAVTLFLGRTLRHFFEGLLDRALRLQGELLATHAEQARTMATLSGEIAHELKNPLASIKGLAGLLENNLADDKGRERLGVLRREVARTQDILGEFLNFTRPLVPLSLSSVSPTALLEEVAALHEGMAAERAVKLRVRGEHAPLPGDPRKLKQVLINLVQNAIEASPPHSEILLSVEPDGSLVVRDRGPGIAPSITATVFDAGVTTKTTGTGLGLTIARGLVRQHGGELHLSPAEGGGTVARVTLPATPTEGAAVPVPPPAT